MSPLPLTDDERTSIASSTCQTYFIKVKVKSHPLPALATVDRLWYRTLIELPPLPAPTLPLPVLPSPDNTAHNYCGPPYLSDVDGFHKGDGIHDTSTRHVNDAHTLLTLGQVSRSDQSFGLGRQRSVQGDEVRALEQLQFAEATVFSVPVCSSQRQNNDRDEGLVRSIKARLRTMVSGQITSLCRWIHIFWLANRDQDVQEGNRKFVFCSHRVSRRGGFPLMKAFLRGVLLNTDRHNAAR